MDVAVLGLGRPLGSDLYVAETLSRSVADVLTAALSRALRRRSVFDKDVLRVLDLTEEGLGTTDWAALAVRFGDHDLRFHGLALPSTSVTV